MLAVKKRLQDAVQLLEEAQEADLSDNQNLSRIDSLEEEIVDAIELGSMRNEVPHDAYNWYLAWQAFTTLDSVCYEVQLGQDFGDEQSDAYGELMKALKEWR